MTFAGPAKEAVTGRKRDDECLDVCDLIKQHESPGDSLVWDILIEDTRA